MKLGQHIALKNKYKDVKALVKSKTKPLHDRASGLKPNHIKNKSQSVEGQQFSHKSMPPGKQLSIANKNVSVYQMRTIDVPFAK